MPIVWNFRLDEKRLEIEASGAVSLEEYVDALRQIRTDPRYGPGLKRLFDASRAVDFDYDFSDLWRTRVLDDTDPYRTAEGKIAFVAPTDHQFGLSNMYTQVFGDRPWTARVFRERLEAERWLGED